MGGSFAAELTFPWFSPVGDIEKGSASIVVVDMFLEFGSNVGRGGIILAVWAKRIFIVAFEILLPTSYILFEPRINSYSSALDLLGEFILLCNEVIPSGSCTFARYCL